MNSLKTFSTTLIVSAICAGAYAQGTLVVVDPTISGDTVTLPIHLQGAVSDGVSALDFQFQFDAGILQPNGATTGSAAAQAGKDVRAEVLDDGVYSVLMFGGNLTGVAQGEVARITMTKIAEPASGKTVVTIADTTFATVSGVEIPSLGSTTSLLFDSEDTSGESGSLPPIGGGGSPAADPAEPIDASVAGDGEQNQEQDDTPATANIPSNAPANVKGSTDARIANLQQARAEREAARAELGGQPVDSRGARSGLRVRRESERSAGRPRAFVESTASRSDAREDATSETARTSSAPGEPVALADVNVALPSEPERETVRPADVDVVADKEVMEAAAETRGLGTRAVILATCVGVALGIAAMGRRHLT